MQEPKQGASGDKLSDDAEVWSLRAGPHKQHHIGVFQPLHDAHLSPEFLQQREEACECLAGVLQALLCEGIFTLLLLVLLLSLLLTMLLLPARL